MKVTETDVTYVADLANLELTGQERQRLAKELNSILDYIERLNQLDTENVPPMAQTSDRLLLSEKPDGDKFAYARREDALRPCLPHQDALRNAPDTDGDFFKVPKVIER
jgi:aspartyl-tRNA(Asn)/glutamyl-tRNA(Gln) amidotransferase subunit C